MSLSDQSEIQSEGSISLDSEDDDSSDLLTESEEDSLFDELVDSDYDPGLSIARRAGYIAPDRGCVAYRRQYVSQ